MQSLPDPLVNEATQTLVLENRIAGLLQSVNNIASAVKKHARLQPSRGYQSIDAANEQSLVPSLHRYPTLSSAYYLQSPHDSVLSNAIYWSASEVSAFPLPALPSRLANDLYDSLGRMERRAVTLCLGELLRREAHHLTARTLDVAGKAERGADMSEGYSRRRERHRSKSKSRKSRRSSRKHSGRRTEEEESTDDADDRKEREQKEWCETERAHKERVKLELEGEPVRRAKEEELIEMFRAKEMKNAPSLAAAETVTEIFFQFPIDPATGTCILT